MSNTRIQAAAEVLPTPDREISPLERMQSMASAWMNATPEAREHALAASQVQASKEIGSVMQAADHQSLSQHVEPETADPMLVLIGEYLVHWNAANVAETDDEADAIVSGDAMCGLFAQIANNPPSPTTISGAAAAVRLVRDECKGSYNPDLIRNVLTVVADALDGQAAMPPVDVPHKRGRFTSSAASELLPIAQLIAFTDAAYRNRMVHLDKITRAERTMPKGSPERQQIEQKDRALCRLYNDGLRAVIRATVTTIEEARAKATFLLRPEFEIADLILGDNEETALGLLRSHLHYAETVSIEPDPLLSLVTEYRTQLDAFNASSPLLSRAEDEALEAKTWRQPYDVLMGGDVPDATTLPGVLAALRELHREFVDCGGADEMAIAMLPSVVAFFDKDAAQKMTAHKVHVLGS